MEANTNNLTKFKKKATAALLGDDDPNPMILVAAKCTGDICVLHSNDPEMLKIVPLMIGKRNPCCVWREFSVQKDARDCESQLKSVKTSGFIPKDPMKVKAAR